MHKDVFFSSSYARSGARYSVRTDRGFGGTLKVFLIRVWEDDDLYCSPYIVSGNPC